MGRLGGVGVGVAWLCLAAPAGAQVLPSDLGDEPVRLSADSVVFDSKRDLYEAEGNVVVTQAGREIRADWLVFHEPTGEGVATGDVSIREGPDSLTASFLQFDVDTGHGVVFDGNLDSEGSGFEMRGAEIAKTGDETYSFVDATFTTCDCPDRGDREPWQFSAADADLEIGGYATARNASFDVLGVPTLWLPWLAVPVKTERQTGLLLPDLGVSNRNGFELGLPFFWAAADPINVTLTPRWLQDRGFKGEADVEYVVGPRSRGDIYASVLRDDKIVPFSRATPYGRNRWAVLGRQDFFLPSQAAALRLKADFAFVSDNQYPIDFDELSDRRKDRFLESTAFVTRAFGSSGGVGAVASMRYADDLQNPDDRDRDDFLFQQPGATVTALPRSLPFAKFLVTSFDADYAYFGLNSRDFPACCGTTPGASPITNADGLFVDTGIDGLPNGRERVDGVFSDLHKDDFSSGGPEGNGVFEEGELLADRGHRVDLWPRLGAPLLLADHLELYPEVGWRETLYESDARGFERRGMFTGRIDARTRLQRSLGRLVTHIVEPRVGYAVVTSPGQTGHPLFVPRTRVPQDRLRQFEFENVVADRADRIEAFNGLSYGVANRFYRRVSAGRAPSLLADISLSNQYDFERGRFGAIYLDGRVHPLPGVNASVGLGVDPEAGDVSEGLADVRYAHPAGHILRLQYRYLRDIPAFFEDFSVQNERFENFVAVRRVSQGHIATRLALTAQWSARYAIVYSFEEDLLVEQGGALEYLSRCGCWSVGVALAQSRNRGLSVRVLYRIVGLGNASGSSLGNLGLVDGS